MVARVSGSFRRRLLALTLAGLAARLLWVALEPATSPQADETMWVTWGAEVLPSPEVAFSPRALLFIFHPPLYVYFVGVPFALFGSLEAVKYAQCFAGALLVPALGLIGRRAFGERAALVAAAIAAFYPELVWFASHFWAETVFTVLLWWAMERLLAADARGSTGAALASGLLWGLAILTRETVLYFLPVAALWLAWRRAGGARRAAALLVVSACVVLPWTLRNWLVFDAFVPVSTSGALNLWQGNTRLSRQEVYEEYWAVRGRIPKYEHARRRAIEAILERQPLWIFEKLRDEVPAFWAAHGQPIVHLERGAYGAVARPRAWAAVAVVLLPYLAVLVLLRGGRREAPARPRAAPPARVSRVLRAPPRGRARLPALPPAGDARRLPRGGARPRGVARPRERRPRAPPRRGRGRARARAGRRAQPGGLGDPAVAAALVRGRRGRGGPGGDGARRSAAGGEAVRPSRAIPLVLLLAIVVRLPFWIEALRTPVDGDTAIVGLMARHPGVGTTFWGQPYGSPLDSWVALPFVAAWGNTTEALRLPYFLLGLLLVPLAYALGRELHPSAGLPAAVLVACPPPYFLLLAALPPPFYPTTLVLCGLVLLTAARAGRRLEEKDAVAPRGTLLMLGLFSGLALWTHLMSATAVAAAGAWVLARSTGRRLLLLWALVPLVAASAPLWSRALGDAEATRIVQVADRDETALAHLAAVAPRLYEPLGGVLGTHVPVVADSEDFVLHAPGWAAGLTVLLYGFLLVLAGRAASGRHASLLYLLAAGLALLVFPLPVRSAPHTLRFLTPLYLPVAALVAWAAAPRGASRRAWVAVLALAVLHLALGAQLLSTWRRLDRAEAPFLLQDLGPARRALEEAGVRHAYASYGPAFRLTWESGERVVRLAALERPLPSLAAAAARRGALRQERGVGADPGHPERAAVARRARRDAAAPGRPLAPRGRRARGDLPRLRAALLSRGGPLAGRGSGGGRRPADLRRARPGRDVRAAPAGAPAPHRGHPARGARRAAAAPQRRRAGERRRPSRSRRSPPGAAARSGSTCAG